MDPLQFTPNVLAFNAGTPRSQLLEIRNVSQEDVIFEARTTHPQCLFARPTQGRIPGGGMRGMEIVFAAELAADADVKLMIQYRCDKLLPPTHEGSSSTAVLDPRIPAQSGAVWSRKFGGVTGHLRSPRNEAHLSSQRFSADRSLSAQPALSEPQPGSISGSHHPAGASTRSSPSRPPLRDILLQKDSPPRNPGAAAAGAGSPQVGGATPVKVFARLRPYIREYDEKPGGHSSSGQISVPWRVKDDKISNDEASYQFDGILFPHSTNSDMFRCARGSSQMADVVRGINCTFFAYGHTGSGKTHTILGSDKDKGLAQRCLESLFDHIRQLPTEEGFTSQVTVSMFEVYSEEINDLFSVSHSAARSNVGGVLSVRFDSHRNAFVVAGLTERQVTSASAALALIEQGSKRRSVGVSSVNDRSSRSHCIFRINTAVTFPRNGAQVTLKGEANIVDLAGSEALNEEVPPTAEGRRETTTINLSLTYLKRVITELSRREKFVSYRNSTLTKVLKHAIGGNSRTTIVCNATLSDHFYRETKSTFQFGTVAKAVVHDVYANETEESNPRLLEAENERLKNKVRRLEIELQKQRQDHSSRQAAPNASSTLGDEEILFGPSNGMSGRRGPSGGRKPIDVRELIGEAPKPDPQIESEIALRLQEPLSAQAKAQLIGRRPTSPEPHNPSPPPATSTTPARVPEAQPTISNHRGTPDARNDDSIEGSRSHRSLSAARRQRKEQQLESTKKKQREQEEASALVSLIADTMTYLGHGTQVAAKYLHSQSRLKHAWSTPTAPQVEKPELGTLKLDLRGQRLLFYRYAPNAVTSRYQVPYQHEPGSGAGISASSPPRSARSVGGFEEGTEELLHAMPLSHVESITLKHLSDDPDANLPWVSIGIRPKQVTIARSHLNPNSPSKNHINAQVADVFTFSCLAQPAAGTTGAEDLEGWLLCLSKMTKLTPGWGEPLAVLKDAQQHLDSGYLVVDEVEFCQAHHIEVDQYLKARDYALSVVLPHHYNEAVKGDSRNEIGMLSDSTSKKEGSFSALGMRNASSLYLHEAELVCRFLVRQGLLAM